MATGIWMAIMGMIFFYLVYLFKRFVLGKSKDQIQLEELKEKEIDIITSNSIFKSKSKKEKQLADVRNEIESLNSKIKHEIINEKVSLPKAVINHSKDIASEIKPTINQYKEKHSTTKNVNQTTKIMNSEINEDEIYEKIMIEIEEDKKVKSTWAKALAQSDGDKNKAESIYIKMRVDEIQSEIYKNIEYLKTKEINKQKEEKFTKNIEITKDEYERINCPHCNNSTYLKEEKCLKCGKDIRKLTYHTIDKYSYYNGKKFTIENRIDNEILTKVGNNFKIVKKALDLNNNENCGLNDYLIDKNNFEYLVLKHGSYYLVISNYGILVQFNL